MWPPCGHLMVAHPELVVGYSVFRIVLYETPITSIDSPSTYFNDVFVHCATIHAINLFFCVCCSSSKGLTRERFLSSNRPRYNDGRRNESDLKSASTQSGCEVTTPGLGTLTPDQPCSFESSLSSLGAISPGNTVRDCVLARANCGEQIVKGCHFTELTVGQLLPQSVTCCGTRLPFAHVSGAPLVNKKLICVCATVMKAIIST